MKFMLLILTLSGGVYGSHLTPFNGPIRFGLCKNPSVETNFKINEYFTGKWYVWKSSGNLFFGNEGSCSGTESKIVNNTIYLLHYQYEPMLSSYVSIRGEADPTFVKFEGLRFPVDYHTDNGYNFSIPYSVLGTDYQNWSAVYFCRQFLGFKIELSWVLVRNTLVSFYEQQLDEIDKALQSIELDLEGFSYRNNSHCGQNEPSL